MEAQRKKEILPQVASLVDIARYGPQQDAKQRVCIKKKKKRKVQDQFMGNLQLESGYGKRTEGRKVKRNG